MMISSIISPSPVFGVLLIIVFIIAAIIDGFRKWGRELDAYNNENGDQELEFNNIKMADELIEISNPWSENGQHFAIATYDKETKKYQAKVFSGYNSTIIFHMTSSKKVLEKMIDETYKKFENPKN